MHKRPKTRDHLRDEVLLRAIWKTQDEIAEASKYKSRGALLKGLAQLVFLGDAVSQTFRHPETGKLYRAWRRV